MARSTTRTTSQLRTQLIRQLEGEAEKLLKQMMNDFTQQLSSQAQDVLSKSIGSLTGGSGSGGSIAGSFDGLGAAKLFSTALNYAFSRPKTSSSTQESSRSQTMRLSSSQAAAEAGTSLSRGNRNG